MKMNRKLWTWIGIILAILAVGGGGWYFLVRPSGSLSTGLTASLNSLVNPVPTVLPGTLSASGTVETTVISIAPELPGKVLAVDFQEGDLVKAGAVLVHLDDSTLIIQRTIAAATLETANLSLEQLASPVTVAALQGTIAHDVQAVYDAQQAIDTQKYFVNNTDAVQSAHSKLVVAQHQLDKAQDAYDHVPGNPDRDTYKAAAYQQLYRVEQAYENALAVYNIWTGVPNPEQVDLRTANLELAQAKLAEDRILMEALTGGPIPDNATGAGIVKLQQARLNSQVAQANLNMLDTRIAKMTITAPVDGVVMTRSVDPGNVVNPGTELLSLDQLNKLSITVYIPQESYGNIKLGQTATVSVDSFPGLTFNAEVVYISAQPQFIPRTSQTVSGSTSNVYAVQLKLIDTANKLKPGMPADVTFTLK
jgi:HlyD family secretion protein